MLLSKLKYWSVYTVFRLQFLFTAVGIWAIYAWLYNNAREEGTAQWIIISAWLPVLFWSVVILVLIGFSGLLIAWLFFVIRLKSGRIKLNVQLPGGMTPVAGIVPVEAILSNVLRPFLGNVYVRIVFPDHIVSEKIVLDENLKGLLNPFNTISGKAKIDLHHRGLHEIEEVQVVLSDMMKMIALPVTLHSGHRLLTLPRELKEEKFEIFPTATEEQDVRINIPRRVQGEFLNYKGFESGDDIRRIVWKIYAKSGELVVRIPETRDPYASHVYICAGFYNELIRPVEEYAGRELLNIYKDSLRQVYDAVKRNEYSVKILRDQEISLTHSNDDVGPDLFYLSTASWQREMQPSIAFDTSRAAVVCVSSAVSADELALLFGKLPLHVPVIVFGLSNAIGSPFRFSIKNVFFRGRKHYLDKVRKTWWISPLRSRLKQNETKIRTMVQQRGNAWLMMIENND